MLEVHVVVVGRHVALNGFVWMNGILVGTFDYFPRMVVYSFVPLHKLLLSWSFSLRQYILHHSPCRQHWLA